jgi:hypothetical protein
MTDDKKVYNDTCETVCLDGFQGRQDGRDVPGSTLTYMCMFPNRTADAAKYHDGSHQDGVWKPAVKVGARASLDAIPAPLLCGDVSASNAAPEDAGQSTQTAIGVVLALMAAAGFGAWVETVRRKRRAAGAGGSKKDLELSLIDGARDSP